MAISHVHPLLLFLLASLFFLPAFSIIDFKYCNGTGHSFGNISRVEISPSYPQFISIYGTTSNTSQKFTEGAIDLSLKIDEFYFPIVRDNDLYSVMWDSWPLEPGKPFVLRAYREKYLRFYGMYMGVLNLFGDYGGVRKELICINFKIPLP